MSKDSLTYFARYTLFFPFSEPLGVSPPQIADIQARYINLTWTAPTSPNGIITTYNVHQNGVLRKVVGR